LLYSTQNIERIACLDIDRPNSAFVTTCWTLKTTVLNNDILLVNVSSRHPLKPGKPVNGLHAIAISPKGMEMVVRAGGNIRVVTEEPATKLVTGVNWVGRDCVDNAAGLISYDVV